MGRHRAKKRPFEYLICLDFEATCWPTTQNRKQDSEIIEFGAIFLNVKSGVIEDQFHYYVRPTQFPELSDYCIGLTGIKQIMVDHQEPFPGIFLKFQNWIENLQNEKGLRFATPTECNATMHGPNTTFCSWSNRDLEFFFKLECQRAGINISPHFKAWIDARIIYERNYPRGFKIPFADALKRANINMLGRAHSAMFDAINLANLMVHLNKIGMKCVKITNSYI